MVGYTAFIKGKGGGAARLGGAVYFRKKKKKKERVARDREGQVT